MKKIIDGKKYDTDTAKVVGSWDNHMAINDFGYCCETLYRKRTGEYFLHGEGGPASRYAQQAYGAWSGGEAIMPLPYETARKLAEEHLEADEYEAAFGEVSEGDETHRLSVELSAAEWSQLSRTAESQGRSVADVIRKLVASL